MENIQDSADKLKPEDFLISSNKISEKSLFLLKELYDLTKSLENDPHSSCALQKSLPSSQLSNKKKKNKEQRFSKTEIPLGTLITQNFDEDQIWEELQLQNGLIYDTLVSSISKVLAYKPKVKKNDEVDNSDEDDEAILNDLNSGDIEDDDDESDFFESDEKYKKKKAKEQIKYSKSIVDDKFFNLAQMTEFVDKMDAEAEKDGQTSDNDEDDDKVDYFKDDEEEANEEEREEMDYYYKDFFDPPLDENDGSATTTPKSKSTGQEKQNAVRFNLEDQEDDDMEELPVPADDEEIEKEEDLTTLSTFEKKRRRIEENIKVMEEEAMKPKSWQLTGEVTAQKRPENSLLEEHLIYDHLLRQAPDITNKTTQKLEDIIKQRIKDQAWDDVIRKIKPIENISEYKKRLVLDAEKSKMSLTEIYEKEYIEKQQTETTTMEEDKDPEEHKAIQKDLKSLFAKLDALSHFNYTPKAPAPEIKTIRNVTATSLEEVTPSTFSEATLLAPQEILEPAKGEIKGKAERSSTDKKRERRLKKKKQHLKRISQEKARAKGLGLRNIKLAESVVKKSKKGATDDTFHNSKELKSSKAFFAKLQEQVSSHIDKVAAKNKATLKAKTISAKKYKL